MAKSSVSNEPCSAGEIRCESWIEHELAGSSFSDRRLDARLRVLLERLSHAPGHTLPLACQDWAGLKAAYRFLSNEHVAESDILAGHFHATGKRIEATSLITEAPLLVLHDTTEFSFKRAGPDRIGMLGTTHSGYDREGRIRQHTVCGILMHSSLIVTAEGLPLGLGAVKFWTRNRFKGTAALKRHINPTRVPIETKESYCWLQNLRTATALSVPERCVHIGDRDSDIYELFCAACEIGTHFVFRTCADRLAGDGSTTVAQFMQQARPRGLHRLVVRDVNGSTRCAVLELKFRRVPLLPPRAKQSRYPALALTVVTAIERHAPAGVEPICWKLVTDLPVRTRAQAIEKLDWYAMRWKIETFHKILKSGCHAEDSRLRTAQRLTNLIALFCLVSWRIFWLTMLHRVEPRAPAKLAFTDEETQVLRQAVAPRRAQRDLNDESVAAHILRLARLGGYLDRAHDPPPGNTVIWRGMTRLADIVMGFSLHKSCG